MDGTLRRLLKKRSGIRTLYKESQTTTAVQSRCCFWAAPSFAQPFPSKRIITLHNHEERRGGEICRSLSRIQKCWSLPLVPVDRRTGTSRATMWGPLRIAHSPFDLSHLVRHLRRKGIANVGASRGIPVGMRQRREFGSTFTCIS